MRGNGSPSETDPSGSGRIRLPRMSLRLGSVASLLTATAIYAISATGIITWLAMHGETTTQRRIAASPSITVAIEKPVTPAPGTTVPRSDDAVPPPAEAAPANDTPLLPIVKAAVTPAPPPVAPAPVMPPAVTTTAPITAAGWQTQTRPFDQTDKRPRIALIITNLGLANNATKAAVQTLPADVTLAFQTIAPSITDWVAQARQVGHEVLLAVPMEPANYPQNDPGPQTLLSTLPATANTQRLDWALKRSNQIIGIMPAQGEAFVAIAKALAPVLDDVRTHQLVFVDGTTNASSVAKSLTETARIPFAQADLLIDATASRTSIDQSLTDLETKAKANGSAVGIALPYPVTFERLSAWLKTLPAKGIVLAPVSAVLANTTVPTPTPVAETPAEPAKTTPAVKPTVAQPTSKSAPTQAKQFGTIPRPAEDLSTIKRR